MAVVTSSRYPYLRVQCQIQAWRWQGWALLDTGFDGDFAVPLDEVRQIGAPHSVLRWDLADGSKTATVAYRGLVELEGLGDFQSEIIARGKEHILGRGILDHLRVTFDHGQRLIVEA